MSGVNVKTRVLTEIEQFLEDYEAGKIRFGVANQHDHLYYESALKVIKVIDAEEFDGKDHINTHSFVFMYSDYEADMSEFYVNSD